MCTEGTKESLMLYLEIIYLFIKYLFCARSLGVCFGLVCFKFCLLVLIFVFWVFLLVCLEYASSYSLWVHQEEKSGWDSRHETGGRK